MPTAAIMARAVDAKRIWSSWVVAPSQLPRRVAGSRLSGAEARRWRVNSSAREHGPGGERVAQFRRMQDGRRARERPVAPFESEQGLCQLGHRRRAVARVERDDVGGI